MITHVNKVNDALAHLDDNIGTVRSGIAELAAVKHQAVVSPHPVS